MFQDLEKAFGTSMEPYKRLLEVQAQMMERITNQQIECTQLCMQATVQQAMELQKAASPQELTQMQIDYTRKLEEVVQKASAQNLQTLRDAHEAVQSLAMGAPAKK